MEVCVCVCVYSVLFDMRYEGERERCSFGAGSPTKKQSPNILSENTVDWSNFRTGYDGQHLVGSGSLRLYS